MVRRYVGYRHWLVALGNASITWVVLIIAPLGLFTVITCTALVLITSLGLGWLGDRLLLSVLAEINPAYRDAERRLAGRDRPHLPPDA